MTQEKRPPTDSTSAQSTCPAAQKPITVCPTKVLVIGGAGFIGSCLVSIMLEKGWEVTVLDSYRFGIAGLYHLSHHKKLHIVHGDVRNIDEIQPSFQGQEFVIHLAGIVGAPACSRLSVLAQDINVRGTENIIKCLKDDHKLVYACTGSVYGQVDGVCDETSPTNPVSLYGTTKLEGEVMCLQANGVSLRLATLIGGSPRLRMDLILNLFVGMVLRGETLELYQHHHKRTFLHVRDACRAFIMACENWQIMTGQVYNVGDERMNCTKLELCQMLQKVLPQTRIELHGKGEDIDQRDYKVSYAKISKLGFYSRFSIDDAIRELVKIYQGISDEDLRRATNLTGI